MENASKALIIAGSVLIALLVISLLVLFYNNITELMNENNNTNITEQIAEFNKQYDVYYRDNLYGSDILSIANKVYDYNKRESQEKDYSILELEVIFNSKITAYNGEIIINKNEKYNVDTLRQKIEYLDDNIEKYGKQKILGKTIQSLSGYRTNELEELVGTKNIEEVQTKINYYLGYKTALSNLKSKMFKATKFEYDNSTKRITLMKFAEN